jgi:hypothetical protein
MKKLMNSRQPLIIAAALVVGWANVILQPCVMAAPQQVTVTPSGHFGHMLDNSLIAAGGSDNCLHCGESDCSSTSGCDEAATVNSKSPSGADDSMRTMSPVLSAGWTDDTAYSQGATLRLIRPPETLPRPVPLTVQNCVFLK